MKRGPISPLVRQGGRPQPLGGLLLAALVWSWAFGPATAGARAAERKLDFGEVRENQMPPGFRSTVTGQGKPGDWKVLMEAVPPLLAPLTPQAPAVAKRPVLAQLAQDPTDDHYPLLILNDQTFGDFTLRTRFKIVSGTAEQMAGVAFRWQDEKNYYYVRASALGNSFYFFKFVNGELIGPVGSRVEISRGVWHELSVQCKGSEITCGLDGKVIIPQMRQDTFPKGKIGFWTKSDAVSYFADTVLEYTPLERFAQTLVQDALKKYPRVIDLKIFVLDSTNQAPRSVASKDPREIGEAGGAAEASVIREAGTYYGKARNSVTVTIPLRDRNGDAIAAARVVMKTFPGQTEANAVIRATPVVKTIQERIQSLQDLLD